MVAGICDDDKNWLKHAKMLIRKYGEENHRDLEVRCFGNEEELLSYQGIPMDVLFLDIELKEGNGIKTAEKINAKWPTCQIVYLTNYLFYATEVYHTEHIFFILKEQFERKIGEIFRKVLHAQEQKEKKLIFHVIGGKDVILAPEDILYFERVKRVTLIETVWGSYDIWDKLDDIEKQLPGLDFVRCHNSYIVYLPAVREMLKNAFIMRNNMKVTISRSHWKNVKEAFAAWALTQMS